MDKIRKENLKPQLGSHGPLFTIIALIVFAVIFLGFSTLRYRKEYEPTGGNRILAPSQNTYQNNPEILKVLQFLSRRWSTKADSLYVLAMRQVSSTTELGIVDASTLLSARVLIQQVPPTESIAHEDNIYLANEFKPKSPQQMEIARQFYAKETPSLNKSQKDYSVIVWWDVDSSGNGNIKALTNFGYPIIPVENGIVDKNVIAYD